MQQKSGVRQATVVLLAALMLFSVACTKAKKDNQGNQFVSIPIKVTIDQIYNFTIGEDIGEARFEISAGPIGAREFAKAKIAGDVPLINLLPVAAEIVCNGVGDGPVEALEPVAAEELAGLFLQ